MRRDPFSAVVPGNGLEWAIFDELKGFCS